MLAPGQRIAGWRLGRRLGEGAHGAVFLALREADGAAAAVKVVRLSDASDAAAFLRQTERAARVRHPDIVTLLDAGVEAGLGWLAMEAVAGTDLARYTQPARLLPEPVAMRIAERIARALAHAHRAGLVHRDLKPANVLVHLPDETVKLADLGLARPVGAESTRTGLMVGTPAYMAPELLAGHLPDAQSDLYALGVTLFELLSGRRPHDADSMGELLRRVATDAPADLARLRPELPPVLTRLVGRLLTRERGEREHDGDAVAAALAEIRRGMPGPAT